MPNRRDPKFQDGMAPGRFSVQQRAPAYGNFTPDLLAGNRIQQPIMNYQ